MCQNPESRFQPAFSAFFEVSVRRSCNFFCAEKPFLFSKKYGRIILENTGERPFGGVIPRKTVDTNGKKQ